VTKCYYTYDKQAGKVLIPHCWAAAISNDMAKCTCKRNPENSFASFERERYNKVLKAKEKEIKDLEREVYRLNRILKRLLRKK
jgi:hypothetical protein